MRQISDAEAYNVIRNGGAAANLSPEMPAWKDSFSENETRDLVHFVHSFCNDHAAAGTTKVEKR